MPTGMHPLPTTLPPPPQRNLPKPPNRFIDAHGQASIRAKFPGHFLSSPTMKKTCSRQLPLTASKPGRRGLPRQLRKRSRSTHLSQSSKALSPSPKLPPINLPSRGILEKQLSPPQRVPCNDPSPMPLLELSLPRST